MIGVCGDIHGHLQLALCAWAIEQRVRATRLDAVLLCGDVGTFPSAEGLDRATRRRVAENPCEGEFALWASDPPAPWLDRIFAPVADGGLGLAAPVIMVTGNHEGFDHLRQISGSRPIPTEPVTPGELPAVDSRARIHLLPSGWRVIVGDDIVVGGIGGIQPGQRPSAGYPDAAYIDEAPVRSIAAADRLDVLITHQGPASVQGASSGASVLDQVTARRAPFVWFHGHSRQQKAAVDVGAAHVVPLGDATFDRRSDWRVGREGWGAVARKRGRLIGRHLVPAGVRELARPGWFTTGDGHLVAPHLAGGAQISR